MEPSHQWLLPPTGMQNQKIPKKSEKNVNILQKGVFRFYTRIGCEYATDEMVIFSYVNLFPVRGGLETNRFLSGVCAPQ